MMISKERYDFMFLVLTLLGWKHVGNGIESGFEKGKARYWFCDDGHVHFEEDK
jgi:hypothetical protein